MALVERILAPVDFSGPSRHSATYAGELAQRLQAALTLLHVAEPIALEYSMVGPTERILEDLTEARLVARREQLDALSVPGTVARRELASGDAATRILDVAKRERTDLIVLATRGANPIQRVLGLGSVTLQVLGGADCPVLTGVHFEEPPQIERGHIVCALDTDQAEPGLTWASRAAREFSARLTIVHAVRFGETRELVDGDWVSTLRQRVHARFTALLSTHGIDADIVIEDGSPREVVATAARRQRAGLVVIGRSTAHDSLGRLRANSFDIIRRSPCPVVSV